MLLPKPIAKRYAMNSPDTNAVWHPARKLTFRFFFAYFFLYCFPFPFDSFDFTTPVALPYYNFLDSVIPAIGKKWFHITARTAFPMFDKMDDSGYGLVFIYMDLIISAVVACTWSIADKRSKNYEKLYQWLKLYLRYYLIAFLFGYGFIKVFPSQFQPITASRLAMTVGDQSPMLLAWNFMGYSKVMMRLNGIAEVVAGLLLLFRRTTSLGAIIATGVFGFVVMMDFCFNVPVRLLASHLLIISIFLMLEDRRKLLNILILNKAADRTIYLPLTSHPVWRKVLIVLQGLLAISILYATIVSSINTEKTSGQIAPDLPLYGVYNITYFIKNGDTIPPLQTDTFRWKQLVIDGSSWNRSGVIQLNSGKKIFYNVQPDTIKQVLRIQSVSDSSENHFLHYLKKDKDLLLLQGLWNHDSIHVLMKKYDLNNYLLHSEKFKWIQTDSAR
jgi:hypothetical protein